MDGKSNVIPFLRRESRTGKKGQKKQSGHPLPVTDIAQIRADIISEERRQVRRTILTEFIGAHVVIPQKGLQQVTIYDVSEHGISLDVDLDLGQFQPGEEVAVRVYMNHSTYFPFIAKVANVRVISDEHVFRHGCSFVKGTVNEQALLHFVKFIELVSAHLESDKGDVIVSNLAR